MAIPTIPTVAEIKADLISSITGKINQGVPSLPLAFVRVLSGAIAGFIFLLYQAILWVYKQIFPETAEYAILKKLGAIYGLKPTAAINAILLCTVPGTTDAYVYSGTKFTGSNNITYIVTADTIIVSGEATDVPLQALATGDIGNLDVGEELDIVSTDLSLDGTATVTSISTPGEDEQSEDSFRDEVIARFRRRTTGGSPADYYFWGLDTPNFDWIGVYATDSTPGSITIYGHVTDQTDGIPTTAELEDLEWYLTYDPDTEKAYRKPQTDTLSINACDVESYDIVFEIQDGTDTLKADIEDEIEDYLPTLRPYIEGISDKKIDILSAVGLAAIANDMATDSDSYITSCTITRTSDSSTADLFQLTGGTMAKVNSITWTDV